LRDFLNSFFSFFCRVWMSFSSYWIHITASHIDHLHWVFLFYHLSVCRSFFTLKMIFSSKPVFIFWRLLL
jgi:hypothetical protein